MTRDEKLEEALRLAREMANGWACYAHTKREHDAIARVHKALDELQGEPERGKTWQPIETAPTDGTTILGFVAHWETPALFFWSTDDEDAPNGLWETRCYRSVRANMFAQPTHWMPLPDPPPPSTEGDSK